MRIRRGLLKRRPAACNGNGVGDFGWLLLLQLLLISVEENVVQVAMVIRGVAFIKQGCHH